MKKGYGNPAKYLETIYVDESCLDYPLTQEILDNTNLPIKVVAAGMAPDIAGFYPQNLAAGKKTLFLTVNKGNFFKPCPGTREYRCCDYQVLNIGMGCPIDCVYCILQAYLNNPWTSFFVNIDDLFAELDAAFAVNQDFLRIGTGEFTDSLALDSVTGLSRYLVPYMKDKDRAILELKSKSVVIDNLKNLDHGGKTVVAWSLNSKSIMSREEVRAATLEERLSAASLCSDWGYRLAFHFDPIIYHKNWQEEYRQTIEKLFSTVDKNKIVWISLGGLRYLPSLKEIATDRFPASRFFYEEFVAGLDGKARYFRELRVEMYRFIVGEINRYVSAKTCVYFCMENDCVWQDVFGFIPSDMGGLGKMLDRAVF